MGGYSCPNRLSVKLVHLARIRDSWFLIKCQLVLGWFTSYRHRNGLKRPRGWFKDLYLPATIKRSAQTSFSTIYIGEGGGPVVGRLSVYGKAVECRGGWEAEPRRGSHPAFEPQEYSIAIRWGGRAQLKPNSCSFENSCPFERIHVPYIRCW